MVENFRFVEGFIDAYPEAAARVLEEQTPDSASVVVDAIADELSVKALEYMLPYHAARCLQRLSIESAARYLRGVAPQLAATILRHSELTCRTKLLDAMPRNARSRIRTILRYGRSSVGAWADTRVLAVRLDLSSGNALARYRNDDSIEHPIIYIVDERRLICGAINIATLMRAPEDCPLEKVMRPVTHHVRAAASLESVLFHVGWDTEDRLPVTDRTGGLVGILRYADLRKAVSEDSPTEIRDSDQGTILDLTNIWHLGMADLITASFAPDISRAPAKP